LNYKNLLFFLSIFSLIIQQIHKDQVHVQNLQNCLNNSPNRNPNSPELRLHHVKIMVWVQDCGCYYLIPVIPTLHWQPKTKRTYLPLVFSSFHSTILSNTSRTVLKQKFTNPSTDNAIKECVYTFPLYDGVSVVKFTAKFGSIILHGIVKEKFEAKKLFDEAVAKGETAGLLEQSKQASDVFSTKLGNIPAGESVVVEVTYISELKVGDSEGTRFTIPTKIAPRYGDGPTENISALPAQYDGGIRIIVDIDIPDGSFIKGVESPSHPIAVSIGTVSTAQGADPVMSKAFATLSLGVATLEKDFVLILHTKDTGLPKALLETHSKIPHQRAIMATLVPKFSLPPSRPEVVFVADRSGSMRSNIQMLISAMGVFLKSMPAGVKFNICSFGTGNSFLWPKSKSYDAGTLEEASQHIKTFAANMGGTQTFNALKATIEQRWGDIPLDVMLLTDGDIWGQETLFTYLNTEVEKSKGQIRIFPLGIGNGVSHGLIEGVARAGNGFAQAVQNGERLDASVVRMLRGALSPHITDYTLEVKYEKTDDDFEVIDTVTEGIKVLLNDPEPMEKPKISLFDTAAKPEKGDVKAGELMLPEVPTPKLLQAPHKIPSLFPFSRTSVYIILSPDTIARNPTSVVFRATSADGPLELEIPIEVLSKKGQTVHQLAARKATQDLEEGRGWIFDARDQNGTLVSSRYPSSFDDLVKREAVRLGEKFQVVNKWCSFVAVRAKNKAVATAEKAKERKEAAKPPVDHQGVKFAPSKSANASSTHDDQLDFGLDSPSYSPTSLGDSDVLQDFDFDSFLQSGGEEEEDDDDDDMGYALFDGPNTPPAAVPPPPPAPVQGTSNPLQDYQMQNMILQQQNKNRLQMKPQEPSGNDLEFSSDQMQTPFDFSTIPTNVRVGGPAPPFRSTGQGNSLNSSSAESQNATVRGTFAMGGFGTAQARGATMSTSKGSSIPSTRGMPSTSTASANLFGRLSGEVRFVPTSSSTQSSNEQPASNRRPYLHESKHNHAMKRDRTTSSGQAANTTTEEASPTPKNWRTATPAEKIHALLDLQNFDGSWPAEKVGEIGEIIGKEVVENPISEMGGKLGEWLTCVVVKWVEMKMAEEEDVWGLVVEKAKGWLSEQAGGHVEGLEKEAEKWVGGLVD
jgi:hypothetical protein